MHTHIALLEYDQCIPTHTLNGNHYLYPKDVHLTLRSKGLSHVTWQAQPGKLTHIGSIGMEIRIDYGRQDPFREFVWALLVVKP